MKFTLEKWQESFIDDVAQNANNQKIANNLRNMFPFPYTYSDAKFYVLNCIENENNNQICRAIVVDQKAVGSIGIFIKNDVYSKNGELGYWLSEDFWHQGIMSSAVIQLCNQAFEKFDLERIYAEPFAKNIGSRKVLEKAGFTLEGILKNSVYKNNVLQDSCMYSLLKTI